MFKSNEQMNFTIQTSNYDQFTILKFNRFFKDKMKDFYISIFLKILFYLV